MDGVNNKSEWVETIKGLNGQVAAARVGGRIATRQINESIDAL